MALATIWESVKQYGAEIGVAVTAAGTVWGWWKFVWSKKKNRDRINTLVTVGDRIAATADIEGRDYEQAIAQYRKALALDPDNVEIYRRIMMSTRRKLELENEFRLDKPECQEEIASALTGLYEFQTTDEALRNDKGLLIEEALFLGLGGKRESAMATWRRARDLHPDEPEILARLGFRTNDVELIRRAIQTDGKEPRYHHYLAEVLVELGQLGEALREYRKVTELATGREIRIQRTRNGALYDMLSTFKKAAYHHGGSFLAPGLDMPLDERVQLLEYFLASSTSKDPAPHFFLAELYHSRGELKKAELHIRTALGGDKTLWSTSSRKPMLPLFARILEDGKMDAAALAEVRTMLGKAA